jgi:hypothetical protein
MMESTDDRKLSSIEAYSSTQYFMFSCSEKWYLYST